MRWKAKPEPQDDDVRIIQVFAFFPVRLDDDTKVWLESYWTREKYAYDREGGWWYTLKNAKEKGDL